MAVNLMCRLCADDRLKCVLNPLNFEKVQRLFPQIMTEDNLLPYISCEVCASQVDDCIAFYDQVLAADLKLRALASKGQPLNEKIHQESSLKRSCRPPELVPYLGLHQKRKITEFKCPHCPTVADCKSGLRAHVRSEHPNAPTGRRYGCRVCLQHFPTASARNQHESVHLGEKPYLCDQCGKAFNHSNNLRIHLNTHFPSRIKFPCDVCHKSFLTRNFLKEHQNGHTGARPFECSTCSKRFHSKGQLRQHRWTHAGRSFRCDVCGEAFTRKSNMVVHVRASHLKQSHSVVAENQNVPDALSVTKTEPTQDNQTMPEEDRVFGCKRCKEKFKSQAELKAHFSVHVDATACKLCGKQFKHHGSLTYHRRVAHTGQKPFPCTHCEETFALKTLAAAHERRVHTHARPFACNHAGCERSFLSACALRTHLVSHSDLQLFTCEHCGRGYKRRSALLLHLKSHNGQRDFACSVCGRAFLQKSNLTRHEATQHQANARPFFCKFCGESFARKSEAGKHALCRNKLLPPTDLVSAEQMLDLVTQSAFGRD